MEATQKLTPESIRLIRNCRGLSQERLADQVRVERSTLTKIESGSRLITPEMERRLTLALNWDDPELQEVIASVQRWREANHD